MPWTSSLQPFARSLRGKMARASAIERERDELRTRLTASVQNETRQAAKLDAMAAELSAALEESRVLRSERARARDGGAWVWSDVDDNDLDSMGDDMCITMTAGQLRSLLAEISGEAFR